ncbi:hypothetical protein [Methylobacterium sp. NEAU K]|uniref:hypothetical protein n=1 Tax=Methylobacterium sp. NEAU K TaxID=3064946 RepID=UPI0027329FB6|nr:hypothetical protein [Methylobacterium sp. NEAU K]MDP4005097.1 hypothetical protein [Methylobacterium sp. NEAU K]
MRLLTPVLHFLSSIRGSSLAGASSAVNAIEAHVDVEIETAVQPIREELLTARSERDAISAEIATLRAALGIPEPASTSTGAAAPLQPGS